MFSISETKAILKEIGLCQLTDKESNRYEEIFLKDFEKLCFYHSSIFRGFYLSKMIDMVSEMMVHSKTWLREVKRKDVKGNVTDLLSALRKWKRRLISDLDNRSLWYTFAISVAKIIPIISALFTISHYILLYIL